MVHPEVSTVNAQLFGRHRQIDGLSKDVLRLPRPRGRAVEPVAERQKADALHAKAGASMTTRHVPSACLRDTSVVAIWTVVDIPSSPLRSNA